MLFRRFFRISRKIFRQFYVISVERSITRMCFEEYSNILFSLVPQGDVARNYLTPEDDQVPEEPEYDKFAYENDKKMWGLDNSFDENDVEGLRSEARKERRLHYTSGTVLGDDYF